MNRLEIPFFNAEVPEDEREHIETVRACLLFLANIVEEAKASLSIFDHAAWSQYEGNNPVDLDQVDAVRFRALLARKYSRWSFIAARNMTLAIFEHYEVSGILKTFTGKSTWIRQRYDPKKFREGKRLFNTSFKNFQNMRHAVAHFGTHGLTPESRKAHQVVGPIEIPGFVTGGGPESKIYIANSLNGNSYVQTLNKKVVSLEITAETVSVLHEITRLKLAAYENMTN